MLNRVILMGRITQELQLKHTQNGIAVLSFSVAVDRPVQKDAEKQTDFISCVAWRQTAEFIARYFGKGRLIALEGSLRTRTYDDKNGTRHYITEVYVDSVSFTGEPKQEGSVSKSSQPADAPPPPDDISIGSLKDYEEIIGDENAPF